MGHKSQEELTEELERAKLLVKPGDYYGHYKHPGEKRYVIVEVGFYESTEEVCVVYKSLELKLVWIRTLGNFLEEVDKDGKKVRRFERIGGE